MYSYVSVTLSDMMGISQFSNRPMMGTTTNRSYYGARYPAL